MPKKVREVIALIRADGWVFSSQRGSHQKFRHPTKPGFVTISGKPSADMDPGTYDNILKQAGLKT